MIGTLSSFFILDTCPMQVMVFPLGLIETGNPRIHGLAAGIRTELGRILRNLRRTHFSPLHLGRKMIHLNFFKESPDHLPSGKLTAPPLKITHWKSGDSELGNHPFFWCYLYVSFREVCIFFWREDWDLSPSHSSSRGNGRGDGSTQGRCGRRKEDKATSTRTNLKAGGLEMFHWWVEGLGGFCVIAGFVC